MTTMVQRFGRMVVMRCQDCGERFEVPAMSRGRTKRCPGCRDEAVRQAQRERVRVRGRGRPKGKQGGAVMFAVVSAPDEDGWLMGGEFSRQEIRSMVVCGCVLDGTQFVNREIGVGLIFRDGKLLTIGGGV